MYYVSILHSNKENSKYNYQNYFVSSNSVSEPSLHQIDEYT